MGSNDHIPVPDPKRRMYYTLDENHVVRRVAMTVIEADDAYRNIKRRRVAVTQVGAAKVSTIFLMYDHGFGDRPLLFETMVFIGGVPGDDCEHCCTWDEAVEQHERIVASLAS